MGGWDPEPELPFGQVQSGFYGLSNHTFETSTVIPLLFVEDSSLHPYRCGKPQPNISIYISFHVNSYR